MRVYFLPYGEISNYDSNTMNLSFSKIQQFLLHDLWEIPAEFLPAEVLRRLIVTTRCFLQERMYFRASALTYTTLFAIVPLLAIIFAIAKGFGLSSLVEQLIKDNLVATPEVQDTVIGFVNSYLSHSSGGIFLGFGVLLLLWTLFNLTNTIEVTFNQIWQVKRNRPFTRQLTDYTSIIFLLPVFIVATTGLSIFIYNFLDTLSADEVVLRPTVLILVKLSPWVLTCLFFTGLFMYIPNTRVKFLSAGLAGVITGIAFQVLQWGYLNSQVWLTSYNAIYGSFAALPLFLLMCQIAWTITLFGCTLAYVNQNFKSFYRGKENVIVSRRYHDYLCLRIASSICKRYADKEAPYSAEELAEANDVHIRLVTQIVYTLCKVGILIETTNEDNPEKLAYVPAYDINQITAGDLLNALDADGNELIKTGDETAWKHFCGERNEAHLNTFKEQPLHTLFATTDVASPMSQQE